MSRSGYFSLSRLVDQNIDLGEPQNTFRKVTTIEGVLFVWYGFKSSFWSIHLRTITHVRHLVVIGQTNEWQRDLKMTGVCGSHRLRCIRTNQPLMKRVQESHYQFHLCHHLGTDFAYIGQVWLPRSSPKLNYTWRSSPIRTPALDPGWQANKKYNKDVRAGDAKVGQGVWSVDLVVSQRWISLKWIVCIWMVSPCEVRSCPY